MKNIDITMAVLDALNEASIEFFNDALKNASISYDISIPYIYLNDFSSKVVFTNMDEDCVGVPTSDLNVGNIWMDILAVNATGNKRTAVLETRIIFTESKNAIVTFFGQTDNSGSAPVVLHETIIVYGEYIKGIPEALLLHAKVAVDSLIKLVFNQPANI